MATSQLSQLRNFSGIPSAAESFNQQHARIQPTLHDVEIVPLIVKRGSLPGDDLEICIHSTLIASLKEVQRLFGRCRRFMLLLRLVRKHTKGRQVVFYLLKRSQHRLPVICHRGVILCDGNVLFGVAAPSVKNCFRKCRARRPRIGSAR